MFLMEFGLLQQNTMIGVFYVGLGKEGKNLIMNIFVNRPFLIMMDRKLKTWHSWQAHSLSESNLNLINSAKGAAVPRARLQSVPCQVTLC